MDLKPFIQALKTGEDFMLRRLYVYASESEYTKYTSTKREEWRMTLREPAKSLIAYLETHVHPEPLHVDESFEDNPSAAFGVTEARLHRARGIKFDMFLGLAKLVRLAFVDLLYETGLPYEAERLALSILNRFFDKFELGFCSEWVRQQDTDLIQDLQATNRCLTNEKNHLLTIFQSMAEPSMVVDTAMRVVEVNHAFLKYFALSAKDIVGKTCSQVIQAEGCANCRLKSAMQNATTFREQEEIIHVEGQRRTVLKSGGFLDDISGKNSGGVLVMLDITDRKQAEEALRDGEERFKQLFDNMADGVAIYQAVDDGQDFIFVDINRRGQVLSSITFKEAAGRKVTEAFPTVAQMGLLEMFRRVYKTGDAENLHSTMYADGRVEQWVENYVFKLPSGLLVALYSDTTEKHRAAEEKQKLQIQLQQAEKMEAVGTLAGGIAHDFNNLLQAISGYTQIMMMRKTEADPDYGNLMAIEISGNRAAQLVRQLLLFSRKVETERKPIDLNQELEHACEMLAHTIPKMIDIKILPTDGLWTIVADPVQIEQILLNLGTNAADAMPDGGKLTINTQNVILDEDYSREHLGAQPGKYVLMTVKDTGEGMDKDTIEKIFEPFFTTKEIGKGTGLGLASVYGIVKAHGGNISCYSEVGQGTVFRIYFPAIEQADQDEAQRYALQPPQGGTETILLVDDEPPIRGFAKQALTKFGYTVLTAASGEEGLEIYSSKSDGIDLYITDINMPGMGGHKFLLELLKIKPDAKVLISSGYSIDGQIRKTLEAGALGSLCKPYQVNDLLNTVRHVLDGN